MNNFLAYRIITALANKAWKRGDYALENKLNLLATEISRKVKW